MVGNTKVIYFIRDTFSPDFKLVQVQTTSSPPVLNTKAEQDVR